MSALKEVMDDRHSVVSEIQTDASLQQPTLAMVRFRPSGTLVCSLGRLCAILFEFEHVKPVVKQTGVLGLIQLGNPVPAHVKSWIWNACCVVQKMQRVAVKRHLPFFFKGMHVRANGVVKPAHGF